MLDRAPDRDPVAVGRGHERVRLDRELGDHRERVACPRRRRARRPPRRRRRPSRSGARCRTLVPASGSPGRSAGSWTSGASGASAPATVNTAGQLLVLDPHERAAAASAASRVSADDRGDRLAVVLRLADREHRPVLELRARSAAPAAAGRRRSSPGARRASASAALASTPRIRARAHVERDELRVEDVLDAEVRDVRWAPVTRPMPPTRLGEPPTRPGAVTGPGPPRPAARRRPRPPRRPPSRHRRRRARRDGLDRLEDLLVAGAPAEVAGQPLLDLGAGRVRVLVEQRVRRHRAGPGCRTRTARRPCRGTPAGAAASAPSRAASPSTVGPRPRRPRPRGPGTSRRSARRRSTVQAPHSPTRQHSFVPVSPRSSRRTSSSVWCGATSTARARAVDA